MKKILVCGSAGFLMSNFIRYVLYRTKDYDFASIDRLDNLGDVKRIYRHKRHSFYVGDVCDTSFVQKVIELEKPDFVVNGIRTATDSRRAWVEGRVLVVASLEDACGRVPIIHIDQIDNEESSEHMCGLTNIMVSSNGGVVIDVPYCFGMRGRCNRGDLDWAIMNMISSPGWVPCDDYEFIDFKRGWAYAEDVASFIWFVIENRIKNELIYHMPIIGNLSTLTDLSVIAGNELGICSIKCKKLDTIPPDGFMKWLPDSISLEDAVRKTARWYGINRWALGL